MSVPLNYFTYSEIPQVLGIRLRSRRSRRQAGRQEGRSEADVMYVPIFPQVESALAHTEGAGPALKPHPLLTPRLSIQFCNSALRSVLHKLVNG